MEKMALLQNRIDVLACAVLQMCHLWAGKKQMSRPKKSLHILLHNPVTNLHIYFNPKYNLLFLNPSL